MKRNPSFAKGMGEYYGVQLDKKSKTGISKIKRNNKVVIFKASLISREVLLQ